MRAFQDSLSLNQVAAFTSSCTPYGDQKVVIAPRNCKKAINDGISLPIEKAVEVEEKLFGDCFETHDQVEGMSCFLSREKPKPKAVFTNN